MSTNGLAEMDHVVQGAGHLIMMLFWSGECVCRPPPTDDTVPLAGESSGSPQPCRWFSV